MPQATTLGSPGKAVTFEYTGGVLHGVTIKYSYGNIPITRSFFQQILATFRGRKVPGGFAEDKPTPNGFGEWIRDNCNRNSKSLTPRHASRIAGILVAEGYATSFLEENAVFINFGA